MSRLYFKVLAPDRMPIYGMGKWPRVGTWTKPVSVYPCESGYHLARPRELFRWLFVSQTAELWLAEGAGKHMSEPDKVVFEKARLVKKLKWNDKLARKFALACAERVLPLFEEEYPEDDTARVALDTAKSCLAGKIPTAPLLSTAVTNVRRVYVGAPSAGPAYFAARSVASATEGVWNFGSLSEALRHARSAKGCTTPNNYDRGVAEEKRYQVRYLMDLLGVRLT